MSPCSQSVGCCCLLTRSRASLAFGLVVTVLHRKGSRRWLKLLGATTVQIKSNNKWGEKKNEARTWPLCNLINNACKICQSKRKEQHIIASIYLGCRLNTLDAVFAHTHFTHVQLHCLNSSHSLRTRVRKSGRKPRKLEFSHCSMLLWSVNVCRWLFLSIQKRPEVWWWYAIKKREEKKYYFILPWR